MTIRTRLTLKVAGIACALLGTGLVFLYDELESEADKAFTAQLRERTELHTFAYFSSKNLSNTIRETVNRRLARAIPGERVVIVDSLGEEIYARPLGGFPVPPTLLAAAWKERVAWQDEGNLRLYAMAWEEPDHKRYTVVVRAANVPGVQRMNQLWSYLFVGFIFGAALITVSTYFFAGQALVPIVEMSASVRSRQRNFLGLRLPEKGDNDELSLLSRTLNRLLEEIDRSVQIQRSFVAQVSHELRTPVTKMISELEILHSRHRTQEEYHESVGHLLNDSRQMKSLVNNLLLMMQTETIDLAKTGEDIRVDDLIFDVIGSVTADAHRGRVDIHFGEMPEIENSLIVIGNKQLLETAVKNIVDNALKYSDGKVTVSMEVTTRDITIIVIDKGRGIPAEDLPYIGRPFYRASNTKRRNGSGVGVPLTARIVELHHGRFDISSEEGRGTEVTVVLPVRREYLRSIGALVPPSVS